MNYARIKEVDIADGIGVRVGLYVSGCNLHCKGCQNAIAQDFNYGKLFTQETINYIIDSLSPDYIEGLSILGGEPMDVNNQEEVYKLIKEVRTKLPKKNIWLWTGYTLEEFEEGLHLTKDTFNILNSIDVLVDGPFILEQRNITSANLWKGSLNQRVLYKKDIQKILLK